MYSKLIQLCNAFNDHWEPYQQSIFFFNIEHFKYISLVTVHNMVLNKHKQDATLQMLKHNSVQSHLSKHASVNVFVQNKFNCENLSPYPQNV